MRIPHLLLRKIVYKIVEHYHLLDDKEVFFLKYHLGLAKEGIDFENCEIDYEPIESHEDIPLYWKEVIPMYKKLIQKIKELLRKKRKLEYSKKFFQNYSEIRSYFE